MPLPAHFSFHFYTKYDGRSAYSSFTASKIK